MRPSTVHVVVDGKELKLDAVPGSLLEALRHKGVKSVKHACGEGGCGACAVMISSVDSNGDVCSRSINSCLMPMYAADGCSITTADGLPRNADGISPIAERMAGFFASQCGFCTPGMAVACHATLAKAASQGRHATAVELRDGLDGNLCRCTGYRPIVDACKSFACDIDLEDLGYNMFSSLGQSFPPPAILQPAHAAAPAGPQPQALKTLHVAGTQQTVYVPSSMEQLQKVMCQHPSARLVAGNTSTGVYKDWPLTQPVLVNIMQVRELQGIDVVVHEMGTACVRVGAAATLAQVIDTMAAWVAKASKQQHEAINSDADVAVLSAAPVWAEMVSHLKRVAGSHVRAAGTMVGNLVMAKERGFASDVSTIMLAAGASMQVQSLGYAAAEQTSQLLPLESFLAAEGAAPSQLVTAAFIPVPAAGARFWSSRIAARYVNAASVINAAAMLPAAGIGQATFVLGMNLEHTHGPEKWRVAHCSTVEAALTHTKISSSDSTLQLMTLLTALSEDLGALFGLPPYDVTAQQPAASKGCSSQQQQQQQHYQYLRAASEGLLLQAANTLLADEKTCVAAENTSLMEGQYLPCNQTPPVNIRAASSDSAGTAAASSFSSPAVQTGSNVNSRIVNGHTAGDGCSAAAVHDNDVNATQAMPMLCGATKLAPPAVTRGTQELLEPDASLAPITYSFPKESAKLQAKGSAQYSDDVALADGALYGAFVLSTIAKGAVHAIDTSAALAAPGAVEFVGFQDVPKPAPYRPFMSEPVFSHNIEYNGQPIGVMLASSYQAALHAAKLVCIEYKQQQQPLLDPHEAVKQGSVHNLAMPGLEPSSLPGSIRVGSVDAATLVDAAPLQLKGVRMHLPAQYHMYMEPQTAVAEVDEDDCVRIHCSTQSYDTVLQMVAQQLGLPHSKVEVKCRRLGGGFGGKGDHAAVVATAAAVAAVKTGKQVRLAVQRNQDMMICGGRCEVDVVYDVGFDDTGKVIALDVKAVLSGGAQSCFSIYEIGGWLANASSVYDVAHMQLLICMAKLNLPMRTTVRAPGTLTGILVMESVMDAVAAALDMDACDVREHNMLQTPPTGAPIRSSIGTSIGKAELYTMPRIWQELKCSSGYEARHQAVERFNASHTWHKRGLSMAPCMYPLPALKKNALVHVYIDGSVRVAHGGVDMGQGMAIKVMQTASYELSKLLPPSRRPLPLDLFRPADPSSYTLPHNGMTAASATTHGACAAVRAACAELVNRIQPFTKTLGDDYTWQDLMNKLVFVPGGHRALADLTASASAILSETDRPMARNEYVVYGAALTEVEIDVLTGDRRVISVDVLMDCGKSINPGIDLGQIEGAFMFGAGFMLGETVLADAETGAVLTNSTWNYKVPGVTCVPENFNIKFLQDSPTPYQGPLGAKAVSEPPLVLACSIATALTAAARAAARQVYGSPRPAHESLQLPATPQHIKHMCGTQPLHTVLQQAAMQQS